MPLQYLRRLRDANLPLNVTEPDDVRNVEMLLVAGLVNARLERAGTHSQPHRATIYDITTEGHRLLQRLDARTKPP